MPANVSAEHVVKRPVLSEKSTWAMNEQRRYTFEVDPRATKVEIKAAIESLYKVKVDAVNTQVRKGKSRRSRFGPLEQAPRKYATVRLAEGSTIELF